MSPFISGGVITGALLQTAPSEKRLEMNSNGIISYNDDNYQDGITIERGTFPFSSVDFYHLSVKVGTLKYDGLGTFSLSPQGDAVLRIHNAEAHGDWNFTNANASTKYIRIKKDPTKPKILPNNLCFERVVENGKLGKIITL